MRALVDGKKIIVSEASIICDLKLKNAEAPEEVGEGSEIPTDLHHTPIVTQPSSSQPQKKQSSRRKQRKETEVPSPSSEIPNGESVPTTSNDPLLSGEDRIDEFMYQLTQADGDEVIMDATAGEKVKHSATVAEKKVSTTDPVTTASKAVTTDDVEVSTAEVTTTATTSQISKDELTLAQTLIEIKEAKPKAITTAATTIITTARRPKAKGVIVQEPSEFRTTSSSQSSQLSKVKDKGKEIMVEPEKPLKKKDQIMMDEDVARNLEAQLQAELEEEERLARQKEEEANIALIESWDNTQAMMDADYEVAQRLQTKEQRELTIEERSKLLVILNIVFEVH
uniref:Uncharacterized protein n=1 Tax=Tanacetum cinerariifolium TaxID=118510 RepID=A0A6L2L7T3_TANCI|nr:hypothetical protein [Tanacetum cinerariifolium]